MSVSKVSKNKVKRVPVKWNDVRLDLGILEVDERFYRLKSKHPEMSSDRISYNALRSYYSTIAIFDLRQKYGQVY